MKKITILCLVLFFLIAGFYVVFQGDIGRNFTRDLLTNALQKSGLEVKIGRIEGTLPHQINLRDVVVVGDGVNLTIEQLRMRPTLWRLFKKELAFHQVHAQGIVVDGKPPFNFDGKFAVNAKRALLQGHIADWDFRVHFERALKQARFTAANSLLQLKGTASLDAAPAAPVAQVQIASDKLLSHLPFQASGNLFATLNVTRAEGSYKGSVSWQIPNLTVEHERESRLEGKGEFILAGQHCVGELTAGPLAKATFDLELGHLLTGTTQIDIENLQSLHIPHFYGKVGCKAVWRAVNGKQELNLDATAANFYYDTFFAEKISLYSDLQNPFHNITGLIDLEIEKGKYKEMELDLFSLETTLAPERSPFKLFAEGRWKHPLELHMSGAWSGALLANLETLDGTFFNHLFSLDHAVQIEWTKNRLLLPDLSLSIAGATALLHIDRKGDNTDARIRLEALPIDFLSLNPLDIPIAGTLNLEANLTEKQSHIQGTLKASIANLQPFGAAGQFEGHFNKERLFMNGHLDLQNKPLVTLDLSLPIHLSLWPLDASLLLHKEAKGHIAGQGRVEEFLDFLDLGPHRLEGQYHCDLHFSHTLSRPLVEGSLFFEEGYYENYYTGTELHNIQADWLAEKNKLYLRGLTADDRTRTGTLTAKGEIDLLHSDLYPFHFDLELLNLRFTEIDLVTATTDGTIHLEGNTTSALAKGDLQIQNAELTIPDHIPHPLPNLQVVYLNPTHPVSVPRTNYTPYPLYLDLHLTTTNPLTISGRGLSSTWNGNFHLGGQLSNPAAKGKLDLLGGEFNFSSRSFKLTEGSLSLSGSEQEMPYLNLAGSMETKGVAITARLKGPLNDPQITLQSTPPLPLGSIMSYLLFGQDLSEISGFQALQIATSLANLAGTGPDVLEKTRRSLGVDRLRIVTDPTAEGNETIALQVGKYVSEGVLVSFTQGAEESSTNVSVEIELKGNFVFQIESDQRQEQGKFTLKWNKNY